MARTNRMWDIVIGSFLLGSLVTIIGNLPPVGPWLDGLTENTWAGLPWLLLAALWIVIGGAAYREHTRKRVKGKGAS